MRILRIFLAALGLACFAASARAAHTQARLILADSSARPGDTVLAGVHLKMEPGWHNYWKNPGAAGMATKIEWQLPPGVTAGQIQWPLPEKMPPVDVTTYAYQDEVMLLVPLKLAADLKPGPLDLKAKVSWLECKEQCIPAGGDVEATLNVGNETKPSAEAALIDSWKQKVPTPDGPVRGMPYTNFAWWESPANGDTRPLIIDRRASFAVAANVPFDSADFFPDPVASDNYEIEPAVEKIAADTSGVKVRLSVKKFSGDWPKEISGILVTEARGQRLGTEVSFSIADKPPQSASVSASANPVAAPPGQPLWKMLLYAFVGGLILNVMPCVLPVIALKILGFVSEAHNDRARLRRLGFVYLVGVLVSFLILAGLVIGLKAAGSRVGWGFQFSSPYFLVVMTIVVTLIALNLFGIFEITLGGRTMTAAVNLTSRRGVAGAFFNGLLATALATSCTAPFLGSAIGFAFTQPASIITLILLTVGFGLAFPYLLLSWEPAWLKFLPRPGPWMEKFKIAMGFAMLGAAVWLCSLVSTFYGERTWDLAIFLVAVALAAWVYGEFVQRATRHRGVGVAAAVLLLLTGYFYELEHQLHWREPISEAKSATQSNVSAVTPSGGNWQDWSLDALAKARSEGHPVLVDFTAKWCLTCQKDVRPVLESQAVQDKLKSLDAVTLLGDYTRFPPDIFDELARHGRAGVPLVLVYPKDGSVPPIVLPEAVTRGIVLSALDQAAK